ncbi:ribosome recycling factor [Escherichia coli]|nr:ribosome recycling factor [Escherichia coli]
MDDNAIHEWLIKCFGPIQGEMAWQQISQLPEEIREQLMSQDPSRLPNPSEVQQMMAAFSAGGLNTMGDMQRTVEEGPINVKLAKSKAEDGKVAVRNIRRKTKETIDKAVKDGEMGEDEGDRLLKDLDKVTKSVTDEIDTLLETKQKEIMEV